MHGPAPLPQPFEALAPYLHDYGYLAVGGVLFIENLGIPFPGETMLIAAALYAGTGRGLNLVVVAVVAVLTSIAGSCAGYVIGSRGGRALIARMGRRVHLTEERLDRLEEFVNRRGVPLIIVGRFVDGLRQFSGIVAGFSDMTWRRFLFATSVGAALWVGCFTAIGGLAGDHISTISRYFAYFAAGAAVVVFGPLIVRLLLHRRKRRTDPSAAPADVEPDATTTDTA